ncbi:RNA polymerase sigma-70 factor [Pedobacter heparinus]|uniref:RNA polymerase sigma factor n=1 Tax=Pedobacter heparinus TaxID=984 RepID=UPI00293122FD|nr:RNA polymerase sigma-70 factor [Pedobacter heparinus]
MKLIDEDLLLAISKGDEEAFKCLFRMHRDQLFAYIFKITKSRETAEEIVMDVFLKIWESAAVLTEIKNFQAFLFHIAKNKALDFLRMAAKDRVLVELLSDQINTPASDQPDDRLLLNELKSDIDKVVARLSPQRKSVFRLSREQHMTYDQIASHLQLSKSTVKNHMLDSLHFIRHHLTRILS